MFSAAENWQLLLYHREGYLFPPLLELLELILLLKDSMEMFLVQEFYMRTKSQMGMSVGGVEEVGW